MHFGFALDSPDIDLWNIDLLDTDLDLLDTDISSKHFGIKCRIPGTRPTYSPVNFTKEHVGQIIFLHFSNSLVNM